MPSLKPAYEAFCQAYVANPNATSAARDAGYHPDYAKQQGYRLLRRPVIVGRIAELRAEIAERECLTPGAMLAKLENAFRAALKRDQPAAAARIVESQAKLVGLLAKSSAGAAAERTDLETLRAALLSMAKQLGLPAPQLIKSA
jgi:phage terminase small subunit